MDIWSGTSRCEHLNFADSSGAGRLFPVRGARPFWESLEDFQTDPHSILVF